MNLAEIQSKFRWPFILGVVFIIFLLILAILSLFRPKNSPPAQNNSVPISVLNPQPVIPTLESRSPVPTSVGQIKTQIIAAKIGDDNGDIVLYKSTDYKIEYIPTPDFFLVTIMTEPRDTNKKSAQDWFLKFGLSQKDLCGLPVRFSLNSASGGVDKSSFSPFPDGC